MKKILFLLLAVSLPVVLPAEEMKFVTTLSQPVGSFARVEAINAGRPARALQVNFCNNKVSSGSMNVNGAVRAAYLKLDNTGSLGGNVPVYQLKTLNLGSGKDFQGGNVWANEANPAKIKADGTLYGKDMSYLVAELPALKITNTANIKRGGPTGEDLEWGAQYTCDYKDADGVISCAGAEKYDSYLLKSKGGDMREPTISNKTCKVSYDSYECSEKITRDKHQDHWGYMQEYYLATYTTNDPGHVDPPCYGRVTCNFEIEDLGSYDGCDMQEGANIDRTKPYTCQYCYYNEIGSCTDGGGAIYYPYCYEVYTGTMTLNFTPVESADTWECPAEKQCGSSYGQCL